MKTSTLAFFALLFLSTTAFSQEMVSFEYRGAKEKAEINEMFGMPIFQCGVKYYKMTYTSVDAKGMADTLSGLVVVPEVENAIYPVLVYEHGTSSCKECVPSRYEETEDGDEGQAGVLFGGVGYVTLVPDYVGMGDGRGFQTYVHAGTSISASEDMLTAFRDWAPSNNIQLNDQLFITGYSQGGYAAMAFHRYMQETYGEESVTAAAHNSGPYSLSGVMRDLILVDSAYQYPAYIPNTFLGMNEVYEMFDDLNEFFEPNFVPDMELYYNGDIKLTELNDRIIDSLTVMVGSPVAKHMIKDEFLDLIENDPDYIINQILVDNDLMDWVPKSPTRMYYCTADDQVPYKNAVVALDSMISLGADAELVQIGDVDPTANHTDCVTPAFTQTLFFFALFQNTTLNMAEFDNMAISLYPNPVSDKLVVEWDGTEEMNLVIWDLNGQVVVNNQSLISGNGIDVSMLSNGVYVAQLTLGNGAVKFQKIVVSK